MVMLCSTFTDGATSHTFTSLNQLKEDLQTHFDQLLKSAGDKLTNICKKDKQIWKMLDDEEVLFEEKLKKIEEIRDEQVTVLMINN